VKRDARVASLVTGSFANVISRSNNLSATSSLEQNLVYCGPPDKRKIPAPLNSVSSAATAQRVGVMIAVFPREHFENVQQAFSGHWHAPKA